MGTALYVHNHPLLARPAESGKAMATFGIDLAGRLVFARKGHQGGLENKYQLLQVIDESCRHPWECSTEEFLASIRTKIDAAPEKLKEELLSIYPNYQLPILDGVTHLDIQDNRFEDEEIIAVLGVLEMPGVDEALDAAPRPSTG